MAREFDVVVFGATGFTGRLVAEYLAGRLKGTPVRWAVAGRSAGKLASVVDAVRAIDPATAVGTIAADVEDAASLGAMAARTQVVLNTVGPYARWGEPVVRACIEAGADQVDLTGEPDYVDALLATWDAAARERGVRIVNCCGFDSVPPDLGAYFTVKRLGGSEPVSMEGVLTASGGMSGGTWHSAVNAFATFGRRKPKPPREASTGGRKVGRLGRGLHRGDGGWLLPLPTIDPAIVRRSARALEVYGPDFRYGHFVKLGTASLVGLGVGVGSAFALAQLPPTRALLLKYRAPGEGPSADERAKSWFRLTFTATTPTRRLVTRVSGGDPGYGETAKMIAEAALTLAQDRERLPAAAGVLTPAVALGDPYLERLQATGIRFEVLQG